MRGVVVFGNGLSGRAAAELLRREGRDVVVLDGDDIFPAGDYEFCVASPGVALSHPWQRKARDLGIPVVSELQLGASRFRGRILAVTGSKGKSSVVKLVADVLGGVPCGNYGKPLCEVVNDGFAGWAVVEVSSFQMETTDDFHPEAAAILNLQEDHLDRHGTREVYHALKKKLVQMAEKEIRPDSRFDALIAGSYFDNEILRTNGEIAAGLLKAAGCGDRKIADGFRNFVPLHHRMEVVFSRDGIRFIDDSKATSLAALSAGVVMAAGGVRRVRLIAGGLPKGDSPDSVKDVLSSLVKKVYLIGQSADSFYASWHNAVSCEKCGTMSQAVMAAERDAVSGDVVLLSPGTASFDQFKNYGARGDEFARLVRA